VTTTHPEGPPAPSCDDRHAVGSRARCGPRTLSAAPEAAVLHVVVRDQLTDFLRGPRRCPSVVSPHWFPRFTWWCGRRRAL